MSIEMNDVSGDLRPRSDFEDALKFINTAVVKFSGSDPSLILHSGTIRQALQLAIKTWDIAGAKGITRIKAPEQGR